MVIGIVHGVHQIDKSLADAFGTKCHIPLPTGRERKHIAELVRKQCAETELLNLCETGVVGANPAVDGSNTNGKWMLD